MKDCAWIVVDMLYDFIDGSMACAGADEAVRCSVRALETSGDDPVLFICDTHPADHCSFRAQGGPWPPHCVKGTRGGEIHADLARFADEDLTFRKGCDPDREQYSGFEGRNAAGQSLAEVLELMEIRHVYVLGIATEYCVRNTAEDLLHAGFDVRVLEDCLAWVDAEGHREALEAMRGEGIRTVRG